MAFFFFGGGGGGGFGEREKKKKKGNFQFEIEKKKWKNNDLGDNRTHALRHSPALSPDHLATVLLRIRKFAGKSLYWRDRSSELASEWVDEFAVHSDYLFITLSVFMG